MDNDPEIFKRLASARSPEVWSALGDNISLTAISVVDMTSSNAIQLFFAEGGSARRRTISGGLVILGGV